MKLKTLNLHLTNRCNMHCRHCLYSAGESKFEEMACKEIEKLLCDFAEMNGKDGTLNLFGGEVFLRKDIFEIIDIALAKKLNVGITTNGNISSEVLTNILKRNIKRLTIDIDGANSFSHDWLRNENGHFEKSLKMIKFFVQSMEFTSSNIVLHKNNSHEIESILDICKELEVNFVSFYLFTALGRGRNIKNLVIGPTEWKNLRSRVLDWVKVNNPDFGIIWERSYEYIDRIGLLPLRLCEGDPSDVIDIRCDGNAYYCGLLSSVDLGCLGNVREEGLKKVIGKRKELAIKIKSGCVALAHNNYPESLIDLREKTKEIVPVCPYDWDVLYGNSPNLKSKFAHIQR